MKQGRVEAFVLDRYPCTIAHHLYTERMIGNVRPHDHADANQGIWIEAESAIDARYSLPEQAPVYVLKLWVRNATGSDPDSTSWALSGHHSLVRREGGTTGTLQWSNFTTIDLQTALNQALFAEIDCRAMISPSTVRRILTPPHTSIPSSPSIHRLEELAHEQLKDVIRACETEFELVGEHHRELDIVLITPVFSAPYRFANNIIGAGQLFKGIIKVLDALRWRCYVHLAILQIVSCITKHLHPERSRLCKLKPISSDNEPSYIGGFLCLLESVPVLGSCTSTTVGGLTGRFPAPVCWLAVILARFRLRPLDVLILLHENGTFGSFDLANVEETLAAFAGSNLRPNTMTAKRASERVPQVMFWLPDGTGSGAQMSLTIAQFERRFSNVKSIYEFFEGAGSMGFVGPSYGMVGMVLKLASLNWIVTVASLYDCIELSLVENRAQIMSVRLRSSTRKQNRRGSVVFQSSAHQLVSHAGEDWVRN